MRAAALSLLIDAFPLQDPSANLEDTDTLRQKQFDILNVSVVLFDLSVAHVCASFAVCFRKDLNMRAMFMTPCIHVFVCV